MLRQKFAVKNTLVEKKPRDINNEDNPCFSCSIEQECCRKLRFLRLTRSEYLQHFAEHGEALVVQNCGQTYLVSSKENQTCPQWTGNKCKVYSERPVECRVFPYTIGNVYEENNYVFIRYHERTRCPQKKHLLMPYNETKKLLLAFAHEAFGNNCTVKVENEGLLEKIILNIKSKLKL